MSVSAAVLPAWGVCADDGTVTSPTGRVYRLSRTRGAAVRVATRVLVAMMQAATPGERAAMRAMPVEAFFLRALRAVAAHASASADEDVMGATLCQWLDAVAWELTWADVDAGAPS